MLAVASRSNLLLSTALRIRALTAWSSRSGSSVSGGVGWLRLCISGLLFALAVMPLQAREFAAPEGEVVIEITGKVGSLNSEDALRLDLSQIESMPVTEFVTNTPWTDKKETWSGVRVNDLLEAVEASSNKFKASALDDYIIEFANVDIDKYPVIIAYKKEGKYLSTRDLGPLWLMFPFDDFPELDTQANRAMAIWQLIKIELH